MFTRTAPHVYGHVVTGYRVRWHENGPAELVEGHVMSVAPWDELAFWEGFCPNCLIHLDGRPMTWCPRCKTTWVKGPDHEEEEHVEEADSPALLSHLPLLVPGQVPVHLHELRLPSPEPEEGLSMAWYISALCNKGHHHPLSTEGSGCMDRKCKCGCHPWNAGQV